MKFINLIAELDQELFLFFNGMHSPFLDVLMAWFTDKTTWIPLYFFLIFWVWKTFPLKQAIIFILYLLVSVGLADFVTSGLMKPFFERLRPCHNPQLEGLVHIVGNCGGTFGFVSSHAANSFALFGGLLYIFRNNSVMLGMMLLWAIITSYSRVYVGVHYPGDVMVGAFIGFFISRALLLLLNKLLYKFK